MFNLQNLAAELRPLFKSAKAREEFDALLHSPEAARLCESQDAELRAERLEHAQCLAALPKKYAGLHVEASKRCAAAAEHEVEAQDALKIAQGVLRSARHAAELLEAEERRARWGAEHALRETADPRLADFAQWCDGVADLARGAWSARPVVEGRSWITGAKGGLTYATNGDQIEAACTALKLAADDSRAMQLQVLDRQSITDRINGHLHNLAPRLEPMRLLNCELNEHGDLVFDRVRKPSALIRDAVTATGFKADAEPSDTPPAPLPKVYSNRTSTRRAQQALDQLS